MRNPYNFSHYFKTRYSAITNKSNLSLFSLVCLVFVSLFARYSLGDELSFVSPRDDVNYHIKRAINSSKRSIDLMIADIKSKEIVDALLDGRRRGVAIQILISNKPQENADSQIQNLLENGFKLLVVENSSNMGNFAIFDGKLLMSGSFYLNDEKYQNVIFSDDQETINHYQIRFNKFLYDSRNLDVSATAKTASPIYEEPQGLSLPPGDGLTTDEQIGLSFEEMNRLFGRESPLSKKEKKLRWDEYKGKYITWTGNISYLAWGLMSGSIMGVTHKGENEVVVYLKDEYEGYAKRLHKGDPVTYRGRLVKRPSRFAGFKVKDAAIIK